MKDASLTFEAHQAVLEITTDSGMVVSVTTALPDEPYSYQWSERRCKMLELAVDFVRVTEGELYDLTEDEILHTAEFIVDVDLQLWRTQKTEATKSA